MTRSSEIKQVSQHDKKKELLSIFDQLCKTGRSTVPLPQHYGASCKAFVCPGTCDKGWQRAGQEGSFLADPRFVGKTSCHHSGCTPGASSRIPRAARSRALLWAWFLCSHAGQ